MAASGVNIVSAGQQTDTLRFFSGDVDFVTLSWAYRFSGDRISANGSNVPLYDWYLPAGATAFLSGTALGGSAMWMKMSATATLPIGRVSARVTTTSAKILTEHFDIQIWTGQ